MLENSELSKDIGQEQQKVYIKLVMILLEY